MQYDSFRSVSGYVFCIEKQNKDGFYFEAKARSLNSGKFYDVRFEGRKRYAFFIYKNNQWNVYFMHRNAKYFPSAFKGVQDLERLESDIEIGLETPDLRVCGIRVKKYRLRGGARIDLPDFPFLYHSEVKMLDPARQRSRYNYSSAPKYLIAARKTKYVKPNAAESLYLFGCNSDEVYNKISSGVPICVTHTYENEKAVAVIKDVNRYDIIPFQHCLKTL